MAKQLFVNNFTSTFIANVKASATTGTPASELGYGILQLNSGASAYLVNPTGGDYYILTAYKRSGSVESNVEIMKVTAVDNTVINECRITVLRAQEGTSAQAYVPGDYVSLRITKGGLANMAQVVDLATKQDLIGTISGLVKGNGANALTAAVAETDYVTPSGIGTLQNKTFASPYLTGTTRIGYDLANFVQIVGSGAGGAPVISAQGTDTNINLGLYGKGSGGVALGSLGVISFLTYAPSGSVNYLSATGSTSGNGVQLAAGGTDTNINLNLAPKGSGVLSVVGQGALFAGSGQRFQADFSSATPANRFSFQTSTTNGSTIVGAIPGGTGTASYYQVYNASDLANASYAYLGITGSVATINSGKLGSGAALPLVIAIDSTERVRVDASGNLILATGSLQEKKQSVAASNIDISTGNYFTKTVSGSTTFTVSNVPASGTVAAIVLDLTNGGSAAVTWWSGVKWAAGSAPTLTASGRDVLGFFTHDGGTTWTGLVLAKDVK